MKYRKPVEIGSLYLGVGSILLMEASGRENRVQGRLLFDTETTVPWCPARLNRAVFPQKTAVLAGGNRDN